MSIARTPPVVSVIVPARDCPEQLRCCLAALAATTYAHYEVIVVDDGSVLPEMAAVTDEWHVRCLRLNRSSGPAVARNVGAKAARGALLLFVDADVCVHAETVGLIAQTFAKDATVDAVFGGYDTRPPQPNLVSQYKNLCHHFVHKEGNEQASTFWSGCGAIKRSVFWSMGGFDPRYTRPCIEDIELGTRLCRAGYRIVLNNRVQVTHLKKWTFWGAFRSDILDRALPWTQLILRERQLPNDLNLKPSQRLSAVLAVALVATLVVGAWGSLALLLAPVIGLLGLQLLDAWSACGRLPYLGIAAAVGAVIIAGTGIGLALGPLALLSLGLLLGIVGLNYRLFAFLARERHWLFAAYVLPLHIGYYLTSVVAFAFGIVIYWLSPADLVVGPSAVQSRKLLSQDEDGSMTHPVVLAESVLE